MRRRRAAGYVGVGVGVALVLLLGAVLILTRTDWGREHVRSFALERIARAIDGEIEIRRVEGNLLRRIRLIDVAIRDLQGRPFLVADTLEARFALRALLRSRIELADVRIVRAVVVLDEPPGEAWNYARIFRIDPDRVEPGPPGWGDWVALDDVVLEDVRLTVRAEWRPPEGLTPAEQEAALQRALASDTREHVIRVPGGYQNVMDFRELSAHLPRVLVAHPDTAGIPFQVARLSGLVRPFSPPAIRVHDMAGAFRIARDSLFMSDVRAVLPASRLSGSGVYALESGELLLRVRGEPVAFADMRWALPQLPEQGGGTMRIRLELGSVVNRIVVRDMDATVGDATIAGGFDLTTGDTLRFGETDLRFTRVETGLVERLVNVEFPRRGRLTGRLAMQGLPRALDVDGDIRFDDVAGASSRVIAEGGLGVEPAVQFRSLRLRFAPLQAEHARLAVPTLPLRGTVEGTALLTGTVAALEMDSDLTLRDPRHGASRVRATGGLDTRGELRLRGMRVRMDPLRTGLVRDWLPQLPAGGTLIGAVRLDGAPARFLDVDGQLAHHDDELGVSRVTARGGVGLAGPLVFRELDLVLEPVRMALVRAFAPRLPLGGSVSGTATLNGSPDSRIAVRGDLVHEEAGERSHVVGAADVVVGPGGRATVDVRLQPLALSVAGRFVPGAGLHGSVAGRLQASGDLADLRVDTDLRTRDGSAIRATGTLDLAAAAPGYDLDMRLSDFDLGAVTWRAPAETDLSGTIVAHGRGLEPATMRAALSADLIDSRIDDVHADRVRLRLGIEAGLARVDSSVVRVDGAEATLDGSFGLVAGRDGVLAYRVAVDSLHAFASWLPGADTAVAPERPRTPLVAGAPPAAIQTPATSADQVPEDAARTLAQAPDQPGATHYIAPDGARVTVTTTRVQSGIERGTRGPARSDAEIAADASAGTPADSVAAANTTPPVPPLAVPTDSLAGALYAAGTLRGNLTRFDVAGRATVDELLYRGVSVGSGEIEYALEDAGTRSPDIALDAELDHVRTADLAFDGVTAQGRYRGVRGTGAGEAIVVARATDDTEYRADVEFTLSLERSELRIADLSLRFDTVTWQTVRPGVVSWGGDAIEVASIDVVSDAGGRVVIDGRLPVDGTGDLDVVVEDLEIAQLAALLQRAEQSEGRLSLDARVAGTLADPRITGTTRLVDATVEGEAVPDLRVSFSYETLALTADAELLHDGRQIAVVEARLPVDLSLRPDIVPRLLDAELSVELRADSLPIDAIPVFSELVDDASGRVRGDVRASGTFADPVFTGDVDLDLGAVRVVPLGVRFHDIVGRVSLDGDVLRVDSLVAHSGGPIRVSGEIGIASPTEPAFALEVQARETRVMDTDDAVLVVDADLTVGGSLALIELDGDVRTRSGVIYIPQLSDLGDTDVVSLHAPATFDRLETAFIEERRALARQRPLMARLRVDVGVAIDNDVWLRSTEANVEIYTPRDVGPLRVRMDAAETGLRLDGTINTDRGEYEFMSRRFNLTRGAATFVGESEMNPILQIAAEHEVRLPGREAFDIRVLLGGTLRAVEITLESNAQPPIAQTDLLSYLALGREANALLQRQGSALSGQAGGAGELAGNAAGLATQQLGTIALDALVSELETDLMRDLRVDVFRITPADLPPDMFTGRYVDMLRATEVEAGRYFSSSLFVAGQLNTSLARPGVRVEYSTPLGVQWITSWKSQWLPVEPTLTERDPRRGGVLGSFLSREWRF
jgi:translocation and assembly module TamB